MNILMDDNIKHEYDMDTIFFFYKFLLISFESHHYQQQQQHGITIAALNAFVMALMKTIINLIDENQ